MASSSSTQTPILYACIAHNTTTLSEATTSSSVSAAAVVSTILPKIDHSTSQKLTYTHGTTHIHYISESPTEHPDHPTAGSLTFLAITDASLGRRIAFSFLLEARTKFFEAFPAESFDYAELPNYGAASFNAPLKNLMVDIGTSQNGHSDAINSVKQEIDDVRGLMTRNIEGLMERGERMDLLVDRTDRLGGSAQEFRVRSRGLKRDMWWKNIKVMAIIIAAVLFVILIIVFALRG